MSSDSNYDNLLDDLSEEVDSSSSSSDSSVEEKSFTESQESEATNEVDHGENKENMKDDTEGEGIQKTTLESKNSSRKEQEKPTWKGERLFPPSRANSKPSKAWSYGGFRRNKRGELLIYSTICGFCGLVIKYKNSPSHLLQHVSHHHESEMLLEDSKMNDDQPSIPHFFKKGNEKSPNFYNRNHPKQKNFRDYIVKWIIDSNRPFAIVGDKNLNEAFKLADPRLKMPSADQVKADIKKLDSKKRSDVIESFKDADFFSCTNDAGSSVDGRSFVDVNVHWIDKEFNPKKKILTVLEMKENKNALNYRKLVDSKLDEFNIKGKVFSFTTDNENTMRAAFSDKERNGCLPHLESKSGKKALEGVPSIKKLRKKLRKIAKKANKSSKFKYTIQKKQKLKKVKVKSLKQEIDTRFVGTN